jgi:hypothetical protein
MSHGGPIDVTHFGALPLRDARSRGKSFLLPGTGEVSSSSTWLMECARPRPQHVFQWFDLEWKTRALHVSHKQLDVTGLFRWFGVGDAVCYSFQGFSGILDCPRRACSSLHEIIRTRSSTGRAFGS